MAACKGKTLVYSPVFIHPKNLDAHPRVMNLRKRVRIYSRLCPFRALNEDRYTDNY
ncbi:MAG: hypothetical protein IGR76_04820 [Synechococcales cyanobacterium T60_A2020_003]|nr:hypothetical protein [Synechococcales cyanobacterium T60_A2020_003]